MSSRFTLRIIVFSIIFLSQSIVFAQPKCSVLFQEKVQEKVQEKFQEKFQESFYDHKNIYTAGFCCVNVRDLLNKLKSDGLDMNGAKVIYILNDHHNGDLEASRSKRTLKPVSARQDDSNYWGWTFHVILEKNGSIYDLDFTRKPEVVLASEYFKRMFVAGNTKYNPYETIRIREIPALEYLEEYSERLGDPKDADYYRFKSEARYPAKTIAQYLAEMGKSQ